MAKSRIPTLLSVVGFIFDHWQWFAATGVGLAVALLARFMGFPRLRRITKEKLQRVVRAAGEVALKTWKEKMVPTVKGKFKREVQDMIYLMPKQELAALAEELINLTSVKRKFSSGRESVGGPIDLPGTIDSPSSPAWSHMKSEHSGSHRARNRRAREGRRPPCYRALD
jgi:hypothetical protein